MKRLRFDTTAIYQKIFDSLYQEWQKQVRIEAKEIVQFDLWSIIELCGAIKDERFVPALKNLYVQSADRHIKNAAEIALVRMNVEPFRKNYFQERIRRIQHIRDNSPDPDLGSPISDIAWNVRNQEAFLELSKFLLSDQPYRHIQINGSIYTEFIADEVYSVIRVFIGNSEFLEIAGNDVFSTPELRKKVYDWMQKNYGKYEFRTWY